MADWQSGFVEANGLRTHYTRTGGDKPPVVLTHGVTDSGLCWTPIAQALEEDYDLIMVDARGHGKSDAPADGYEPATLAADLAGVIQGLSLHKPAVLGHSMGAATALAMAGLFPDLPGAILLEDPPPWWMGRPVRNDPDGPDIATTMRDWIVELKTHSRDEMVVIQRGLSPTWPKAELGPWADAKVAFNLNGLGLFHPRVLTSVDWAQKLPAVSCPVLLIYADTDRGAIVSAEAAAALQAAVPQTRAVHIGGAGHNIRREQPAAYLNAVRSFLSNV